MTRAEMTEIFAVLMLAYPNAEMFKAQSQQALKEKLAPTITLWTTCLPDVDFWTAQNAVVKLCRTCKFPPTIAEMREASDGVLQEMKSEIQSAYLQARNAVHLFGDDLEKAYASLPTRSRKVIDAMGGMQKFIPDDAKMFDMFGFERTYERLMRQNPAGLPGGTGGRKRLT